MGYEQQQVNYQTNISFPGIVILVLLQLLV